jgi:2-polyprenyl-3-methyl-5-hydroxy-6-metoxy-1,4-benzoquinol methylase
LRKYLSDSRTLRVLDFGCGQGGLLETMALEHKQHRYYGCDSNAQTRIMSDGVSIHRDFKDLIGPFDLIVLSHVVEHLVDFEILERVFKLLSQTGVIYIEVPNPGAYESYARREFLYYFDRLHVNHFTFFALNKITDTLLIFKP